MQDVLFEYEMHPTTWVYLASLLIVGIYFKFHRFWSVRNLDLVALIFMSPGLLLLWHGNEQWGYVWLFAVGGFFLVRLLLDPVMVRRPLLEPNLSPSGLTFTGVALLIFLMTNVVTGRVTQNRITHAYSGDRAPAAAPVGDKLPEGQPADAEEQMGAVADHPADSRRIPLHPGPGYPPFYNYADGHADPYVPSPPPTQANEAPESKTAVRATAVVAHLFLAVGIVLIGYRHFDNIHTGVAMASLYLLLPYASQMPDLVTHVVPAVALVWAVASYRRPLVAGLFLGLAGGLSFYPLFLLPLWCSFYWRRGMIRFALGAAATLVTMALLLLLSPPELGSYSEQLQLTFGALNPLKTTLTGFWKYHEEAFRVPVLAAFVALCGSLVLWPPEKNLGTLLSCSAVLMLGTQFWIAQYGGLYMAWYLPLLILTSFRPNLEDRVAASAVVEGWYPWSKWLSRIRPKRSG